MTRLRAALDVQSTAADDMMSAAAAHLMTASGWLLACVSVLFSLARGLSGNLPKYGYLV